MDLSHNTDYYHLERFGSTLAVAATLFILFVYTTGLQPSFAQNSTGVSTSPNQTSTSQKPGIPMITAGGVPGQGPEQQQQQYSLYENPQNNFSIQYPSDWTVRQGGGGAGVIATFSSPYESNFDPFIANLVIGVENVTSGASLENYTSSVVALLQSVPAGGDFRLSGSPVATTFGGFPARQMGFIMTVPNERSLSSETNVEGLQVWTVDNNTAYVLSFAAEQDKLAGYLPIMEHIIDTFRITRTEV